MNSSRTFTIFIYRLLADQSCAYLVFLFLFIDQLNIYCKQIQFKSVPLISNSCNLSRYVQKRIFVHFTDNKIRTTPVYENVYKATVMLTYTHQLSKKNKKRTIWPRTLWAKQNSASNNNHHQSNIVTLLARIQYPTNTIIVYRKLIMPLYNCMIDSLYGDEFLMFR